MTQTAGLLSLPCTARGGTVVVITRPDPALLLSAIPVHRVTECFLPPTLICRLLDIPDLNLQVDFSSLKYVLYGAAPMSLEKLKQAIEVFGPVMMGGYGQTEAPTSISFLTPGEHFVAGEIALALVVFATWKPWRVLAGAYLFGGVTLAQFQAQALGLELPSQFLSMLPYLATILVLAAISRDATTIRLNAPASLGTPFHAGT